MTARLTKVTVTGVDDTTRIADLVELAKEFPFVEWGVLVSSTAQGVRFPSVAWTAKFLQACFDHKLNVAMHVCGRWVREIFRREMRWVDLPPVFSAAQRVQLNTHAEPVPRVLNWWDALPCRMRPRSAAPRSSAPCPSCSAR
jgi:hypothetical protein